MCELKLCLLHEINWYTADPKTGRSWFYRIHICPACGKSMDDIGRELIEQQCSRAQPDNAPITLEDLRGMAERTKKSDAAYTANAQNEPRSRGPASDKDSISGSEGKSNNERIREIGGHQ